MIQTSSLQDSKREIILRRSRLAARRLLVLSWLRLCHPTALSQRQVFVLTQM